jgi:hypothetical protein
MALTADCENQTSEMCSDCTGLFAGESSGRKLLFPEIDMPPNNNVSDELCKKQRIQAKI